VRRTQTQIEDAYLEREIETAQKELAVLESETVAEVKATQTEKARKRTETLQAKIDAARRKVQEKEEELARKLESVKEEGDRKIAVLDAQKATATAESRAALERRLADVRSDYERRTGRLQEVVDAARRRTRPSWDDCRDTGPIAGERRFYVGTVVEVLVGAGHPRRDGDRIGCLRVRVAAGDHCCPGPGVRRDRPG
jgi:hypothetical protein